MKKILLPLALGVVLGSCNRDEVVDTTAVYKKNVSPILAKIVKTENGKTEETVFKYNNGNELKEIVSGDIKLAFKYENGVVVSMVSFDKMDKELVRTGFVYNERKLKSSVNEMVAQLNNEYKTLYIRDYTHNPYGDMVTMTSYVLKDYVDSSKKDERSDVISTKQYTLEGPLVKKVVNSYGINVKEEVYEYAKLMIDPKSGKKVGEENYPNPLKNIRGFDAIALEMLEYQFVWGLYNLYQKTTTLNGGAPVVEEYVHELNQEGYPLKVTVGDAVYTYEYKK